MLLTLTAQTYLQVLRWIHPIGALKTRQTPMTEGSAAGMTWLAGGISTPSGDGLVLLDQQAMAHLLW